jgi:hypothetical protein
MLLTQTLEKKITKRRKAQLTDIKYNMSSRVLSTNNLADLPPNTLRKRKTLVEENLARIDMRKSQTAGKTKLPHNLPRNQTS